MFERKTDGDGDDGGLLRFGPVAFSASAATALAFEPPKTTEGGGGGVGGRGGSVSSPNQRERERREPKEKVEADEKTGPAHLEWCGCISR